MIRTAALLQPLLLQLPALVAAVLAMLGLWDVRDVLGRKACGIRRRPVAGRLGGRRGLCGFDAIEVAMENGGHLAGDISRGPRAWEYGAWRRWPVHRKAGMVEQDVWGFGILQGRAQLKSRAEHWRNCNCINGRCA